MKTVLLALLMTAPADTEAPVLRSSLTRAFALPSPPVAEIFADGHGCDLVFDPELGARCP